MYALVFVAGVLTGAGAGCATVVVLLRSPRKPLS